MRPKPPKSGKRILLERIPWLWNRISFMGKLTLRNVFRYKSRFWMTAIGVGGCTALILAGFGLRYDITSIADLQYSEIMQYDLLAVYNDDAELFERLRALRKEISTELEMAPYMVFSDKALRGLCRLRPQTREELIRVNGIGEKKADAFGEQFMAAIEEFESEHARDGA